MFITSDDELLESIRPDYRNTIRPLRTKYAGDPMTPKEMVEFNIEHARRFFAGDFDGIMNHSLIDNPVYEFFPLRLRVSGKEAVHRYHQLNYDIVIAQVDPKRRVTLASDSHTYSRTFGDNTYATEISGMFHLGAGEAQRCYMNAIIPFENGRMVGERVWLDQNLADFFEAGLSRDKDFFNLQGVERF